MSHRIISAVCAAALLAGVVAPALGVADRQPSAPPDAAEASGPVLRVAGQSLPSDGLLPDRQNHTESFRPSLFLPMFSNSHAVTVPGAYAAAPAAPRHGEPAVPSEPTLVTLGCLLTV